MATLQIDPELEAARRAIRPAAVFSVLVGGALGVAGACALLLGLQRYQVSHCPPATFLVGPEGRGTIILILLNFFALYSPCILGGLVLCRAIAGERAWRRWATAEYGAQADQYRGIVKFLAISTLALATLTIPIDLISMNSVFCLTPSAVYLRSGSSLELSPAPWSDVSTIETRCGYGRGGWGSSVVLEFKGGQTANLASAWPMKTNLFRGAGYYKRYIPEIWEKLHPFKGDFDASEVRPPCPVPERAWLMSRP
jgi:hypothetical protein